MDPWPISSPPQSNTQLPWEFTVSERAVRQTLAICICSSDSVSVAHHPPTLERGHGQGASSCWRRGPRGVRMNRYFYPPLDISLYSVEWRTCAVNWPSDRHALYTRSWLIRSHWFGSPIMWPWYYLQRQIKARAKFSPLAASERFTLRRRRGVGVLKPHPNTYFMKWAMKRLGGKGGKAMR